MNILKLNTQSEIKNSFDMLKGTLYLEKRTKKNLLAQILGMVNTSPSFPMIKGIED